MALLTAALVGDATPTTRGVRIVEQSARWTGLTPADDLQGVGETMFVISGEVENSGPEPVAWVKLGYDLLDGSGADAAVCASEYGYNHRAEALRGATPQPTVQPLGPGERDLFRMTFFRSDVPHCDAWRVHILEVR